MPMKTVSVDARNGRYEIRIGPGLLKDWVPPEEYAVVSDENVMDFHGRKFPADRCAVILPPGEESKNMTQLEHILNTMVEMNISRHGTLIAFGGGVVGDITGFAAACYKRGIAYIQIPTTLLAQVDSSVGGKVAVDLRTGKNLAGAFLQPQLVLIDTDMLKTLPAREYAAGMAEVIKYGYIADRMFHDRLQEGDVPIEDIIETCCRIKAWYVNEDPYDHGIRAQLNYGHTIGHALETAAGYGKYLHGEAVGIGMVCAAAIGERLGISPPGLRQDTERLLSQYHLPTGADREELRTALAFLAHDKKAEGAHLDLVLIDKIGHAAVYRTPITEIQHLMEALLNEKEA